MSDLKSMEVTSGTPTTLLISGRLFKAGMLTGLDWAACSAWRSETQAAKIMGLAPPAAAMGLDYTTIKAEAISRVMTKPFDRKDLLGDVDCVLRLTELSLKAGGEWTGSWELFKRNLSNVAFRDCEILVLKMSGLWSEDVEKAFNGEAVTPNPSPPTVQV